MSVKINPIKISKDSAYSEQFKKLETLKEQASAINEDYLEDINISKAEVMMKKVPVLEKMREIFKTIPDFWAIALSNTRMFTDINDEDVYEFARYITDFEVCYNTEIKVGGKILITFKPNPFMKNTFLCRDIISSQEAERTKALKVRVTEIEWKAGKELFSGPTKGKADFSPGSFICWLQDRNVIEMDLFILQDFFPSCLKDIRFEDEDFSEDDNLYSSNEDVSFSEEDDYEGYEEVPSEDEQPASKKARKD